MENDKQEKAAFFAQYWGQNVHRYPDHINVHTFDVNGNCGIDDYLELLPLSAITDDHAIEVAQRLCPYMIVKDAYFTDGKIPKLWFKAKGRWGGAKFVSRSEFVGSIWNNARCADYLRKNGFLIQYDNYTPQQLLDMGWAKLKSNNQ